MSKRAQGVVLRSSRYDHDNLAVAKLVLADVERHPVITVTWARLVLARHDAEQEQRSLPLEQTGFAPSSVMARRGQQGITWAFAARFFSGVKRDRR